MYTRVDRFVGKNISEFTKYYQIKPKSASKSISGNIYEFEFSSTEETVDPPNGPIAFQNIENKSQPIQNYPTRDHVYDWEPVRVTPGFPVQSSLHSSLKSKFILLRVITGEDGVIKNYNCTIIQ
jgi:hypothetical protein